MSEKDKAAPVGEREAFEAWLDTLPDATGAIAMAKDEWDEQQARYFKRESCPDLNSAFAAFKAGAAYQRQVHAEHEGPDYGDGPEFEGWAERSGQQPQSAEAFQKVSVLKDCNVRYSITTAPQPSAGVVIPERKVNHNGDAQKWMNWRDGWNACLDEFARLNGKEVGRG